MNRCVDCKTPIPPSLQRCGRCLVKKLDAAKRDDKNGNGKKGGR